MLTITIPSAERYDEIKDEFVYTKEQTIKLEHSLISISKWEAKWHKPFLSKDKPKTNEENIDYIRCMTITQNVDPNVYYCLTDENRMEIGQYIENPMTATVVPKEPGGSRIRETMTSELIYYWMITLNIPVEFQTWHLNRLLSLIDVCNFKNKPPKKMNRRQIMNQNAALNAQRKAMLGTKG